MSNKNIKLETKIELLYSDSPTYYDNSLEYIIDYKINPNIPKLDLKLIHLFNDDEELKEYREDPELSSIKNNINEIQTIDNVNKKLIVEENDFEILEDTHSNNEHIVKSRSRGTSISDINWGEVTKKFIFG